MRIHDVRTAARARGGDVCRLSWFRSLASWSIVGCAT